MKKISIFGTGYVGLVTGICFAELGNYVVCVDIDKNKISGLKKGKIPIYEPGLEELLKKNISKLEFTTDGASAIKKTEIIFIAVGTPQGKNGGADLKYVEAVAEDIGKNMQGPKIIVIKSTVPVGSEIKIAEIIKKHYKGEFTIVSNPEFLREGSAIKDFLHPDRVIIGSSHQGVADALVKLYEPLNAPIFSTDLRSAQLIKYASNAYLATKISFMNEMANLAEKLDANIENIALGMGYDKRIGSDFLRAGVGYGGSCFPKDVKELIYTARLNGSDLKILDAVEVVNDIQKVIPVKKLKEKLGKLDGAKVAILGLSFKPNTDDLREAPSLAIIRQLLNFQVAIKAWDPVSISEAKKIFPQIEYFTDIYKALEGVDGAIIVTEWDEIKKIDLKKVKELMKKPIIIDGRNVLNQKEVKKLGFEYSGIGR